MGTGYYCSRVRKIKSKGAGLVLLWSAAVWCINYAVLPPGRLTSEASPIPKKIAFPFVLWTAVYVVYCPVIGWLADVYFKKYNVLRAHLLLVWIFSVVATLVTVLKYCIPHSTTVSALNYYVLLPTCVLIIVGQAGFTVTVIPFGVDQMQEASAEGISAFIHWFIWLLFVGKALGILQQTVFTCFSVSAPLSDMIVTLLATAFVTLALCSNFVFKEWLVVEPCNQNPLRVVVAVLKYAATHKRPAFRSAFTYWEQDIPSRIDLAKTKYGGTFTTEQVEDVKTFFRILLIIASVNIFNITNEAMISVVPPKHYMGSNKLSVCGDATGEVHLYIHIVLIVVAIPLYELFVYPLARDVVPSMLKRIGLVAVLSVSLSLYLLSLDFVGHSQADVPVPCMFLYEHTYLHIHYLWVEIPFNVVIGIQYMIFYITTIEFIFAQSPQAMRGLLTGLALAVIWFFTATGNYLLFDLWSRNWKSVYSTPSCGVWYFLSTTLIGFVCLLVLVIVARWYKQRQRDEQVNEQAFVEEYYDRYTRMYSS